MESRTDVRICRPLVVRFVNGERIEKAKSSEIHYIQFFV